MTPPPPTSTDERSVRFLNILLCLASVIVLLLLARPLLTGTLYTLNDLGNFHIPYRVFYQTALHSGDSFLWIPGFFNGMYLYGEGQAGMAHPLHWLLYRTLPLTLAFNLEFILSYIAMYPGMYLLLKRLGMPSYSALLGAFLWTFSGFNLLHGIHMNAVAIVAHIPWLLLVIDTILTTSDRRALARAQAGLAFLTASQLLLGYPQYVFFSLIAEVCFAAWRCRHGGDVTRLAVIGPGLLIGVMLGGIQLIPTREMLHESVRSVPTMAFRLWISLDPRNLIELWSPYAVKTQTYGPQFTHEVGIYNGAFSTLALAWLCMRRRDLGQWHSLVKPLAILLIVLIVFACGSYVGVYRFVAMLPVVNLFRGPARYIVLIHFVMAMLSAIALTDMVGVLTSKKRLPWPALWPLAVPIVLGVITTVLFATVGRGQNTHTWLHAPPSSVRHAGAGLCFVLAATLISLGAARGVRGSLYGLPLLLIVDTFFWGVKYVWRSPPVTYAHYIANINGPPLAAAGETVYGGEWGNTDGMILRGLRNTFGYVGLTPAKVLDPANTTAQRLAGARWAKGATYPHYIPVSGPMPRVRLVDDARVSANIPGDIKQIDIARTALVDRPVSLSTGTPGTARLTVDRPGHIEIDTQAPSRQLLVLSESYNTGWHITEDNHPVPLLRAYGDFQACPVDAGTHHLMFRFEPESLVLGAWLTLTGVLVEIAFFLLLQRRPRVYSAK